MYAHHGLELSLGRILCIDMLEIPVANSAPRYYLLLLYHQAHELSSPCESAGTITLLH
jgi:hypothetical protein